jgi:type IV secretion system protein TrbJ
MKNSATKMALMFLVAGFTSPVSLAHAGIPVIDGSNLSQNVMTAIENIAQTIKQVQQYQTQLEQYQNMLQNTAVPNTNTWDQAQATMRQLDSSINTLGYYKNQLGSINNYLGKFPDTATYMNSPCYSPQGCTSAQWAALSESRTLGNQSQKKATDALFQGMDLQQRNMVNDAARLQQLQSGAQGAQGQVQAIGYANQLASHTANQLLQIRGLLISQQNVIATRNQALANKEAQEAAAAAQLRSGTSFVPSPIKSY